MPPKFNRLVITSADIKILLGCSQATAYRKLIFIHQCLGKQKQQLISIKEFCEFYGFDFNEACLKLNS